ncbi:hypothetical protein V496_10358 [Pseudogymnoascus sp. VKM F-4515 (FW-2607)]|nr:hypothetical protein V496_10358 [Pseudogymnoascus sp. VKM F-4515 (FW-2607)]
MLSPPRPRHRRLERWDEQNGQLGVSIRRHISPLSHSGVNSGVIPLAPSGAKYDSPCPPSYAQTSRIPHPTGACHAISQGQAPSGALWGVVVSVGPFFAVALDVALAVAGCTVRVRLRGPVFGGSSSCALGSRGSALEGAIGSIKRPILSSSS